MNYINMLDVVRSFGNGNSKVAELPVAEVLAQSNPILQDLPAVECNLGTIREEPVRTGIPEATFTAAYEGVQPTKSTTKIVQKRTGHLESLSQIDEIIIKGDVAKARWNDLQGHVQGMSNKLADYIFHGKYDELRAFEGLENYYKSTSESDAGNYVKLLETTESDQSALGSIYLLVLSPQTIFSIYKEGTPAGIKIKDDGNGSTIKCPNPVDSSKWFNGYSTTLYWDFGLMVKDFRYGARLANINTKPGAQPSESELLDGMMELESTVQDIRAGVPVFYMPRKIYGMIRKACSNKANVFYNPNSVNQPVDMLSFDGIKVSICDALTVDEAVVA